MAQDSQSLKFGDVAPSKWPGERLGLPEEGPGSVGRVGRRVIAIFIDWIIATMIGGSVAARLGVAEHYVSLVVLGVFAIGQIVFIPTLGGSLGHLVCGLRVVALKGGWIGLWRPVVRTVLLCLVIPVLVWDSDQRGFHDKIPGTVLIRAL